MSAAVTPKHGSGQLSGQAETGAPEKLEPLPVMEVARVRVADVGSTSDHGMTPLMRAACDGSVGTVQALLDRGADINAKRSDGFNALTLAAFFGHLQLVWLLLENAANLDAIGRTETPPEQWADARGFQHIGELLREARATKQAEAGSLRTSVIEEPARFPRPAETQRLQPASDSEPVVEVPAIDEARDSETTLVTIPALVPEESTQKKVESTADISPGDKPELNQEQLVITNPLPALKTLPEIEDQPPLVVPEFHPGSVFVARITSSRKNLVALIVAVWLVGGGIAAFLVPQIRKSWAETRTNIVTSTSNSPASPASSNPVGLTPTNASPSVDTSSPATTEPATAPASSENNGTTADSKPVESASRDESAAVSATVSPGVATESGSESRAHTWSASVPETTDTKSEFSVVTPKWRAAARARRQQAFSRAAKFKQQVVVEEQPRPAPLSVEPTRSRSVISPSEKNANGVSGNEPPPLSIISGKPKSKVIQWP